MDLSSQFQHGSHRQRLHKHVELSAYDGQDIIVKFRATVDRCHLHVKQGEVFVNCVDNLGVEGLQQGALGPEEAVKKVSTRAYLPMRGQGSNDDL